MAIAGFAVLHAIHLGADFPNHSPWMATGPSTPMRAGTETRRSARISSATGICRGTSIRRRRLPVWPFLEWMLFSSPASRVEAARGLAVAFFFANLLLSYLLLRAQGTALDGAAGAHAAGDQSLSLLLQPAGDS